MFKPITISLETINQYINNKYLKEDSEGWTLNYPDFLTESRSSYFTKRIKNPKNGVGKYIRTANEQSHIFRPLNLHPDFVQDIEIPLILYYRIKHFLSTTSLKS